MFQISPTMLNIDSKSKLFDETSVVFGLFIGYLIADSKELPVNDYYSNWVAYYCIQGRGVGAMIGVFCLAISSFVRYSISTLLSQDIRPDTEDQEQKLFNQIFSFISKIEWIQMLSFLLSYVSLTIFISGYCLELYSIYHSQLNFDCFFFIVITGAIILVLSLMYIYYQKSVAFRNIQNNLI